MYVSFLSWPWARQLSWIVPAHRRLLYDECTALWDIIKCGHCTSYKPIFPNKTFIYTRHFPWLVFAPYAKLTPKLPSPRRKVTL